MMTWLMYLRVWDYAFVGVYWISLVAGTITQAIPQGDMRFTGWEAVLDNLVGPHFQKNI